MTQCKCSLCGSENVPQIVADKFYCVYVCTKCDVRGYITPTEYEEITRGYISL